MSLIIMAISKFNILRKSGLVLHKSKQTDYAWLRKQTICFIKSNEEIKAAICSGENISAVMDYQP